MEFSCQTFFLTLNINNFQDRPSALEMLQHNWIKSPPRHPNRRLSKRTSSMALGVGDVNLNISISSTDTTASTDTRSSIILSSEPMAELNDCEGKLQNPPKKARCLSE